MRSIRRSFSVAIVLALAMLSLPGAFALNIVVTNDHGFEASMIHALYQRLKAAGDSASSSVPDGNVSSSREFAKLCSESSSGASSFLPPA